MLWNISIALIRAESPFTMVSPGIPALVRARWIRVLFKVRPIINLIKRTKQRNDPAEIIGEIIGKTFITVALRYPRWWIRKMSLVKTNKRRSLLTVAKKGLGASMRTRIGPEDKDMNGRIVKPLHIMYHDANRAGKHIDLHFGHLSMVIRVSGKPVEDKIKYNRDGWLTEESKKALLNHIREEIANNSRVVWNHDHTVSNAKCTWKYSPELMKSEGYGAGPTRQPIITDKCEFYHPNVKSSLHIYAPVINPDQGLYTYQIYPGSKKTAPINILGQLIPRDSKFKDRLHLKLIQPEDLAKFKGGIDERTNTRKYDGASMYFSSNGQGFKFFSPRLSKVTGHRIEYTFKLCELADKGHSSQPEGMAECMFYKLTGTGKVLQALFGWRGPEWTGWKYIEAAEIGGILNSHKVRPREIKPEAFIYRMDKWNGRDTSQLEFFQNRKLQSAMANYLGTGWKTVKLMPVKHNRRTKKYEGFVGVPFGRSINDGLKTKWHGDLYDWRIDKVSFYLSEKQNIAGIVECTSLDSGKKFNLGPGQVGTADRCMSMIESPEEWKGVVLKVSNFNGFEGRAAKVREIHLDKGMA